MFGLVILVPDKIKVKIGPSGVRALPLAAGINIGGHYFRYYSSLVVLFLPPLLKSQKGLS